MTKWPRFQPCNEPIGGDVWCCDGVVMDIDEYTEGWQPDVIYRPHSCNPRFCASCNGSGEAPEAMARLHASGDCVECEGTGWRGRPMWPRRRCGPGMLRAY